MSDIERLRQELIDLSNAGMRQYPGLDYPGAMKKMASLLDSAHFSRGEEIVVLCQFLAKSLSSLGVAQ